MTRQPIDLPARPKGLTFEIQALADPRFELRANAVSPVISIFDAIGRNAVSTAKVVAALRDIGPRPVTVEINSPGGDVFEGNAIVRHPQPITVQILGIAASAAAIIAMAGASVEIAQTAELMIHNAQGVVIGDRRDLAHVASILATIDENQAAVFAARTKLDRSEIVRMLDAETFLSAKESVELGFADKLLERDGIEKPKALNSTAPTNKREFESSLRNIGLSRSQAAKAANAAWPSLKEGGDIDLERIAARLDHYSTELKGL